MLRNSNCKTALWWFLYLQVVYAIAGIFYLSICVGLLDVGHPIFYLKLSQLLKIAFYIIGIISGCLILHPFYIIWVSGKFVLGDFMYSLILPFSWAVFTLFVGFMSLFYENMFMLYTDDLIKFFESRKIII